MFNSNKYCSRYSDLHVFVRNAFFSQSKISSFRQRFLPSTFLVYIITQSKLHEFCKSDLSDFPQ